MEPYSRFWPNTHIGWNGGRNGWVSFIVGFGWMPNKVNKTLDSWGLHIYLGLWVLTIQSKDRV